MNRLYLSNLFVSEKNTGEYRSIFLVRKRSRSYVDKQKNRAVPSGYFAVGEDC